MTPLDLSAPISSWLPTEWYGGYLDGLPDLCVGKFPPAFGKPWKIWVVERPAERAALLAALARPVPRRGQAVDFQSGPDAAVATPGQGGAVVAYYPAPRPDWPHIVLARAPAPTPGLQRGRYAYEAYATEMEALAHVARLRAITPGPIVTPPRPGDRH